MCGKPWGLICSVFFHVQVFVLTILLVLIGPVFIIFLTPIFIHRLIIFYLAKCFNPKLGKMVNSRGSIYAVHDLYNKPKTRIALYLELEGKLEIDTVRKEFQRKILEARPENRTLHYPEFQQYLQSWGGYMFWNWEKCFDLSHHIYEWKDSYLSKNKNLRLQESSFSTSDDKEKMNRIIQCTLTKPYIKGRSPWEIILWPNINTRDSNNSKSNTGLFFFYNRAMGDAQSIARIAFTLAGQNMEHLAKPTENSNKKCSIKKCLHSLVFLFRAPYEFVYTILNSKDQNEWHKPENKLTGFLSMGITNRIPLDYFREIRIMHNTSVSAVLLSGIAGGIRNTMLKQKMKIPRTLHVLTPILMPRHKDNLRNFNSVGFVELPLEESDPIKRLQKVHKSFQNMKKSTFSSMAFSSIKLMGSLLPFMFRPFSKNNGPTGLFTNVPGLPEEAKIFNCKLIDYIVAGSLGPGNLGFAFCTTSYNGAISLGAAVDNSIFPSNDDTVDLLELVKNEFELLRKCNNTV